MKINFTLKPREVVYLFIAPLLFAVFPVLFLYSRNIQEVPPNLLTNPLLITVIVTLVISTLLIPVKNKIKTGLILSLFWIFFFSYGHILSLFDNLLPAEITRHRYVLPFWTLVLFASSFFIFKTKLNLAKFLQAVIGMGFILVAMQIVAISQYASAPTETSAHEFLINNEDKSLDTSKLSELPNIYYILLDGYPRSDTLKKHFGFDNKEFDNFLKSNGFFIATKSHSNYNQTGLSVPSTMNMSYLNDSLPKALNADIVTELYLNNKVLSFLKRGGYQYINNSSLYSTMYNDAADFNTNCGKTNEFQKELIALTILKPFKIVAKNTRKNARKDVLCVISNIDSFGSKPKFVFTHLLPPHPPYIFGENGEDVQEINLSLTVADRWLAKEPFLAQLKFMNKQISAVVAKILKNQKESIIVIQSDHGTLSNATEAITLYDTRPIVLRERARNYFAVYLPDLCDRSLMHESITNVNTFRTIFNSCFAAGFDILEDKIYYDEDDARRFRNFIDITDIVLEP